MAKIRERDRSSIMNAIAGGVTPRQGIQHIQVGRLEETAAILADIEQVKQGGGAVRVIQASYGSGKALRNLTLIDTEDGFKAMGDIRVGDKVLGTDGKYHNVVGVYPQGRLPEWRVGFSNGVVICCSGNHLWTVVLPDGSTDTVDTAILADLIAEHGSIAFPEVVGKAPVKAVSVCGSGRECEMTCIKVDAPDHLFVLAHGIPTHNTFFLTLSKTVALKQNMLVMSADLSPDRRLYASDGKANNLYRELVRNLSSVQHPDGGALEELLNMVDEKVMSGSSEFLSEIRKLPYGYDAISVCNKWHVANNPITDKEKRDAFILKDACLRWFAGENTAEHKKMLGVRSSIGDEGAWDALKMIAMLGHFAGYAGLLVEFDECVNLYKINNSTSRDRNYEQILRIFNECLQGDAKYVAVIFSGTPEFVMDPRRGLFSYDALKSRLVSSEYADKANGIDTSGPVIDLMPLSQEDLLVLLGNLTNVEALADKDNWLLDNDQMVKFLERQYQVLGADYYRTPRELLRSFVMLLRILRENPEMDANELLGTYEVKSDKKASGLGMAMTDTLEPDNSIVDAVDDEDFGF